MVSVALDCSALDPGFKEHAQRGIGRYVGQLAQYFERAGSIDHVRVGKFDHRSVQSGPFFRWIDFAPMGRTTLRQQIAFPIRLNGSVLREFDLLHFPAHMDAPAFLRKPYVLTVLDLIPLVLSDLYRADRPTLRFHFARWLELRAIRQATMLLAISENTARDLERVLGIDPDRIVVTPLGVDEKFLQAYRAERAPDRSTLARLGVAAGSPTVLYVGGIDQRKNTGMMVDAFTALVGRARSENRVVPTLLLVGRISQDRQYSKLRSKIEASGVADRIIEAGFLPDEELLKVYGEADAFFFPSLYEGFGLPVLEALACGLPVASSSASSLPEVLGDCGRAFDPASVSEACEALYAVLYDREATEDLRRRGHQRARIFSWERTGELTVEGYRRAGQMIGVAPRVRAAEVAV
jgi:alpha-1,3-rhamnosyl/mannosyltransferase